MAELRSYNVKAETLNKEVTAIPVDLETRRLLASLAGIRTKVVTLLSQTEQSHFALEEACGVQERRQKEIEAYKQFLDDTTAWLETTVLTINNFSETDCEVCTNSNFSFCCFSLMLINSLICTQELQVELSNRTQRVTELEKLPEVNSLAMKLKEALLELSKRLQQKQQVLASYQNSGYFILSHSHYASVKGTA